MMVQGIGNNQEMASAMHVQIRESWIKYISFRWNDPLRADGRTDIREHLLGDAIPFLPMAEDIHSKE